MKKLFLFICIVLFFVSIHQDLTEGTPLNEANHIQTEQNSQQAKITGVKVQVEKSDTVLSITEQINQHNQTVKHLDISKIMEDFKTLNHNTSPLDIESGDKYFFPLYDINR